MCNKTIIYPKAIYHFSLQSIWLSRNPPSVLCPKEEGSALTTIKGNVLGNQPGPSRFGEAFLSHS